MLIGPQYRQEIQNECRPGKGGAESDNRDLNGDIFQHQRRLVDGLSSQVLAKAMLDGEGQEDRRHNRQYLCERRVSRYANILAGMSILYLRENHQHIIKVETLDFDLRKDPQNDDHGRNGDGNPDASLEGGSQIRFLFLLRHGDGRLIWRAMKMRRALSL